MEYKVVVLGDKGVGKTSLVLRFIEGYFMPKQQSTVGAFFLTKKVTLPDGTSLKMQIWDTAGQERFRAMAPMYYRNAAAAIICFDITNQESFVKMQDWVEELTQNVPPEQLQLVIASNKADLEDKRVISLSQAEAFAQKVNAMHVETSAKENLGIEELFKVLGHKLIARAPNKGRSSLSTTIDPAAPQVVGLETSKSNGNKSSGCC